MRRQRYERSNRGNLSHRIYLDDESASGCLDCGAVCIHCWDVEADAVLRIAPTPAGNEIVLDDLCDIYMKRPRHVDAARPVIVPVACGAGIQEPGSGGSLGRAASSPIFPLNGALALTLTLLPLPSALSIRSRRYRVAQNSSAKDEREQLNSGDLRRDRLG